jgi:hypothetical protein
MKTAQGIKSYQGKTFILHNEGVMEIRDTE